MSKRYSILFLLVAALFFQNCGGKKQNTNESADTTVSDRQTTGGADISLTERLAELGLTTTSDWRGISIGDDFSKVKSTEKAELFENDDKHAGYTLEFKNLESADMLYYQDSQHVSGIDVDLFLNSRQSVDGYMKELGAYFNARYGASKAIANGTQWSGSGDKTVTMKDVSKGKDFGLKIKIESASSAMTASIR